MKRNYFLILLLALPTLLWAQDASVIEKIRKEGLENSQVMDIAFHITEMSGPRLTGSPGFYRAAEYSINQMKEWGITDVELQPWGDFGKSWELKKSYIAMTAPWYKPLVAFPKTWTHGTDGLKKLPLLLVDAKDSTEFVNKYKGQLAGKIIIMDQLHAFEPSFTPDLKRYTEEQLDEMQKAQLSEPDTTGMAARRERFRQFREARRMIGVLNSIAQQEGALAMLSSSTRNHDGTVFVQGGGAYGIDDPANFLDLALALEDYNMLVRLLREGVAVEVELEVESVFHDKDTKGYNVIGEIKGTDPKLKDEVVMIGGHLDSWQGSTGATDNAAGVAVMMEAMRIIKALNISPRRTIRIGLWSGEEQGIFGSRNYVKNTFADMADMKLKPAHETFNVYFNLDNGTGRIRGIYLQENEKAHDLMAQWMKPFHDLDAKTITVGNTGGTDHLSFDGVGLPGFQFIQDEVEYSSRTHHSTMDSYDHLVPDDLKQAATIIAGMIYQAAMSDQKVPRKELPEARQSFW